MTLEYRLGVRFLKRGTRDGNRTGGLALFSRVLFQLSYLGINMYTTDHQMIRQQRVHASYLLHLNELNNTPHLELKLA